MENPLIKLPPHSLEAEISVLGGLLLEERAWDEIASIVSESDFYRSENRVIFRAVAALADAGRARDVVTVNTWLETHQLAQESGGLAYLIQVARDVPSAANIRAYAEIVRERAVLRQLASCGSQISDMAFVPEGRSTPELLDQAERLIFEIADKRSQRGGGMLPLKRLVKGALDRIDYLYEHQNELSGLSTGLKDFDDQTSGLQNGDLIIVAGRPSMGKTSFAMNIVEHVAIMQKKPCAVFSMEMSGEQLAMRLISSWGRIEQGRVRNGKLDDTDWARITSAVTILADTPIFIDDTPALSPSELRARARRLKREHGLSLIVIDYLQLMQVPGAAENRATEIAEISRSLKALAKELSVPVIALSQLNRSLEQRPNKRPVMSDLRESGAIEQDADIITFIYRDEVYNKESADRGIAEIIIGKQRNGPIGTVRCAFLGPYTRFENLMQEYYEFE